jgi:hypothetical protein
MDGGKIRRFNKDKIDSNEVFKRMVTGARWVHDIHEKEEKADVDQPNEEKVAVEYLSKEEVGRIWVM